MPCHLRYQAIHIQSLSPALHPLSAITQPQRMFSLDLCRGEVQDPWVFREFLPKPWQDLVTMRVLVRGPTQGGRPSASMTHEQSCFAAKWQTPHADAVQKFVVTEHMLVQC